MRIKLYNSSIRSFKDVNSFSLNDSEFPPLLSRHSTSNHLMLKKQSDQKSRLLPTNKSLMSTCLYANMYVSTSRAYMLPTSADCVLCLKSCIMSSQSFATVLVVPPVCLTTSISNNVIKKPITCRCSVMKLPCKFLRKSTILKNRNAMNYVSEPVKRVVNCSRSTSTSSSGFVCQPVRFNKSVHKHVSSWVVNKPILSINPSETFRTIGKCRNKFYDVWVQFLILFSLVSLNYKSKHYCE